MSSPSLRCTAFSGSYRIASGELRHVALKAKQAFDGHPDRPVLVFDDADARTLELPLELPAADLLAWLSRPQLGETGAEPERPRRPGRPKLGVVAREVTLLPRHWDWLAAQPGGASVALRRLVDDARKVSAGDDRRRAAQEAAYRFMQAMAGNEAGFEDAARALFAGDFGGFEEKIQHWPDDVRDHAALLAADAFIA
ncbi:DUF2239 family protein [Thermomonas brevis]|uniref:DUF2239 family protein n=1 Tax=Thermomonas brevis TaxID=215691 RepID=A0A7G9QPP0_9GAMM|nr:DUF2239 family protein [Thermomonas brevis]QNN45315.1 DUF2239 family protein [Thermomonas brevis]